MGTAGPVDVLAWTGIALTPAAGVALFALASCVRRGTERLPERTVAALRQLTLGLGALPLLWLVAFYALVVWARLDAGHWPSEFEPAPPFSGLADHGGPPPWQYDPGRVALAVGAACIALSWLWLPGLAAVLRAADRPLGWARGAWMAAAPCVVLSICLLDPGSFVQWAFGS